MTTRDVLSAALPPSNQYFRFIFLDFIWRSIWLVGSVAACLVVSVLVLSQISSLRWQGPDLGGSGPIIALAALRQFWHSYGAILLSVFGLLLLLMLCLWIVLESLFRGGWKAIWLYAGTAAARMMLLFGTAGIFILLSAQDESSGTLMVGAVVVAGLWFLVALLETVVRRDAVDLLATSLLPVSAVMGCLWLAESVLAFILLGSAAIALLRTTYLAVGGLFAAVVVLFWMLVHSYLLAVRYSAIDIMRRNVFGA